MTIVEHLKSDTDVLKLIVISLGAVFVFILVLWLLAVRYSGWRKTAQGKRKQLQRPFVTKRISLTPKNDSPTFRYGPFNHWSRKHWSSSPKTSLMRTSPSPTNLENSQTSTANHQKKPENINASPRFLGQIISCINKSNPKSSKDSLNSPRRKLHSQRLSPIKDYKNPFILEQSTSTDDRQDSTLPSLLPSSDSSTDFVMEKCLSDVIESKLVKVDKGVNTDSNPEDSKLNNNNKAIASKDKEISLREHKKNQFPIQIPRRDDFTLRLWSHKCNFPCHSIPEHRTPYGYMWSCDSSSSSDGTGDPQTDSDEQDDQDHHFSKFASEQIQDNTKGYCGKQFHARKCAADVCVQTEFSGDIQPIYCKKQESSPLCSSDSTLKENDSLVKCCCRSEHEAAKQSRAQHKLKKFSLLNNLTSECTEDSELLRSGLSISDRTSFIPSKSWYSLGSLCDEDENCKTCGGHLSSVSHYGHHTHSDDSDTKLNLSTLDAVSYNDTGYTSTEEESVTHSDHSKDMSSCERHSSPENVSYDGDYESDDEIFHCRLVASDDMVYKPLPSISEPYAIDTYASKEWTGNTPKAKAIREGYAAIPNHVSCHQLRQIRGDNYCAIRAALFQALVNGIPVLDRFPTDDPCRVIRKLDTSMQRALHEWSFAGRLEIEKSNVMSTLEEILVFYVDKVQKCEELPTKQAKTDYLLSLFNEETGNNDFRLLEAVKIIMLYHAVEMYQDMNQGKNVPFLAWLLFARDSSTDPQQLLRHHLNHVGDSGGLEQVEMCLLGYALGVVIQVFRPSQVNNQDFIANYPYLEDVPPLTPTVTLVAEDDRHYNILVD